MVAVQNQSFQDGFAGGLPFSKRLPPHFVLYLFLYLLCFPFVFVVIEFDAFINPLFAVSSWPVYFSVSLCCLRGRGCIKIFPSR